MKIGWFAPFAVDTALAEFSARTCDALAALGHEPRLVRLDEADSAPHAFAGEVMPWRAWPHLQDADAIFYNIGDDFAAYAPAYDLIRRMRGIAIFHDAALGSYFAAHAAARGVAEPPLDAASSLERVAVEVSGAVVVGDGSAAAVAAGCAGPVLRVPAGEFGDPDRLAVRLDAFAVEVAALEPVVRMLGQVGDRLRDMTVPRGDPLTARVAAAARFLLPEDADPGEVGR